MLYDPQPHPTRFYQANIHWWILQSVELLVIWFYVPDYYSLLLRLKYFSQNSVVNRLKTCYSPNITDQVPHPHTKCSETYFCMFNPHDVKFENVRKRNKCLVVKMLWAISRLNKKFGRNFYSTLTWLIAPESFIYIHLQSMSPSVLLTLLTLNDS